MTLVNHECIEAIVSMVHISLSRRITCPTQVRNIVTSHLPGNTVRNLLQLAGASSLSMKPPLPLLVGTTRDRSGPAVVIGVVS